MNLSADAVGKPISLMPSIYYGVTDRFQLGLVHDGPMRWQTRPGPGLCLTGKENGCPEIYDNVGVDAMFGLMYGQELHLSAHATLYLTSFDPVASALTLGVSGKIHLGDAVAVAFDPQVGFVLTDRDISDDGLFMPIEVQYQLSAPTSVKLLTGISGTLADFGDNYEVPVGLGVVRNLTENFDLGARFSFDNLLGAQAEGAGRADSRSLALLLTVRR